MKHKLEIRAKLSCPSCWTNLRPAELLWISAHPELRGDEFLGEDALKRFLPSRFDAEGFALDANGVRCQQLACPSCHLPIPRILVELQPLFLSIVGAPSSGKSYFLASCIWEARQRFRKFQISFTDSDPVANQILSGYEQKLFLNDHPDRFVAIPKTEEEGELYQSVDYGNRTEMYARPFVFSMQPNPGHALIDDSKRSTRQASRALCLYDNAGEHFQARVQSELSPATDHLALSEALLFVFDPLQHPKFRQACREISSDPQLHTGTATHRQDEMLLETAKRIRTKSNLAQHERVDKPLVIVVNKYDVWRSLVPDLDLAKLNLYPSTRNGVSGINLTVVESVSRILEELMQKLAPEIVAACSSFGSDVTFIPASPQGCSPEKNPDADLLGVRPGQLSPIWAEVPLLYAIARSKCMLMPELRSTASPDAPEKGGDDSFKPRLYETGS